MHAKAVQEGVPSWFREHGASPRGVESTDGGGQTQHQQHRRRDVGLVVCTQRGTHTHDWSETIDRSKQSTGCRGDGVAVAQNACSTQRDSEKQRNWARMNAFAAGTH